LLRKQDRPEAGPGSPPAVFQSCIPGFDNETIWTIFRDDVPDLIPQLKRLRTRI
jgi:hypothetical protein